LVNCSVYKYRNKYAGLPLKQPIFLSNSRLKRRQTFSDLNVIKSCEMVARRNKSGVQDNPQRNQPASAGEYCKVFAPDND
jgi:hypothetical protein